MKQKTPAHPAQSDLEDQSFSYHQTLTESVVELLIQKKIIATDELHAQLEKIDSKNPAEGAKLIARAWVDANFNKRLLKNLNLAAGELGIDAGHIPIRAVQNTPTLHNIIVCTLCSCYPRLLIGLPPDWYKSRAYRARAVREPRTVLKEFGTNISTGTRIEVHDSTADLRYIVIPMRPVGSDSLNEEELAKLITRDNMIGMTVVKPLK